MAGLPFGQSPWRMLKLSWGIPIQRLMSKSRLTMPKNLIWAVIDGWVVLTLIGDQTRWDQKSHLRFQTHHIGMTLTKAEALFHLTQFEQALLHFHNGLVGTFHPEKFLICSCLVKLQALLTYSGNITCCTACLKQPFKVLDPGNEAFNLGIRRCRRTLRQLLPRNIFQVFFISERNICAEDVEHTLFLLMFKMFIKCSKLNSGSISMFSYCLAVKDEDDQRTVGWSCLVFKR